MQASNETEETEICDEIPSYHHDQVTDENKKCNKDPFVQHFENLITEADINDINSGKHSTQEERWESLGILQLKIRNNEIKKKCISNKCDSTNSNKYYIKESLLQNLKNILQQNTESDNKEITLTPLQMELLSIVTGYHDFLYTERTFQNAKDIYLVYTVHVLNHIFKARTKVTHHNSKLLKHNSVVTEYRDQGLTRPRVLILLPFKNSALKVVKAMMKLIVSDSKDNVMNKKRFLEEFTSPKQDPSKKLKRPDDYEYTFDGNTDDAFRVGIQVMRKGLKLYADFYSADIILASPLGLRTIIGAVGEKDRDYDFLSSIEVFVVDQADVLLMQNWDHVLHLMQHLHLQPKEPHGVDFSRVYMWALNGWAKYYRQTVVFTSVNVPPIMSLFIKYCQNYAGSVILKNSIHHGSINQVVVQLPQVFHRFDTKSFKTAADDRFQFFISKVLPDYKDSVMSHTLIFVPSYFDFVRLRNYFKREDLNFVQLCEYTSDAKVARARNMFYHGWRHFLLCTERFHFYRRYRLKGIQHIIFYGLPQYSHFYSELCNFIHPSLQQKRKKTACLSATCTVLYCRYDAQELASVVGTVKTKHMINSDRKVHMFVSGEA
ncbi:U3 small nucleolar RNA-associated protein 25 homolog [Tachypleus tridentatus]|uniref:U3 small nucleolar RNA-associated protein 25 homolog n=1 Tax=Tachypleus tridentatus TaxID=6853 RepID=UPI003FD1F8FF